MKQTICCIFLCLMACLRADELHMPKPGSPERKEILDALRVPLAAAAKDYEKEVPALKTEKLLMTPFQFSVQDGWAWVAAGFKPEFAESQITGLLRLVDGKWEAVFWTFADDVPDIQNLRKRFPKAPAGIFPKYPQ